MNEEEKGKRSEYTVIRKYTSNQSFDNAFEKLLLQYLKSRAGGKACNSDQK